MSDSLSRAATLVTQELRAQNEACIDVVSFGVGEMTNAIVASSYRRIKVGLAALGYSPNSFVAECEARTTPRFVYDHGLDIREDA